MKKNTAGQVIGHGMTTISDGSPFAGTVTVFLTLDNGAQAQGTVNAGGGAGVCVLKANGYYTYTPSQAETNANFVAATFKGTGAYTATDVYPTSVQTGDSYARLGAPVGASISADIQALLVTALTESYNADGSPASAAQLLYGIFQLLSEMNIGGTTVTVKKLDGTTTAFTLTLNAAINPTNISRAT